MNQCKEKKELDMEWIELMKKARALGLTTEEIRFYLMETQQDNIVW